MPSEDTPDSFSDFQWSCHPDASGFIRDIVNDFLAALPEVMGLIDSLFRKNSLRLIDWIDHIKLNRDDTKAEQLEWIGYLREGEQAEFEVYTNPRGLFPPVLLWGKKTEVAIRVESVDAFLAAHKLRAETQGLPGAPFRVCRIFTARDHSLAVAERHGFPFFSDTGLEMDALRIEYAEKFRRRPRDFENDEEGYAAAGQLIDEAIGELGRDLTCHLWFAAERDFWMSRNRAGRVQKARLDKLGLGWANHDHHTYRTSRRNFQLLIAAWEKLGLRCRERFYAGREAGWGAQVMEHPSVRIVTFNDVDLTPEELMGNFSHTGLPEQTRLGTVGLWCELHGDSFLQAGMHHLAALFDFEPLAMSLEREEGIKMMKPFSDFPHLRQAFTEGERWSVDPRRVHQLLESGSITPQQAARFQEGGAIGSHLENIERNEGFKGFNQAAVNTIIRATDPRENVGA